MAPESVGTDVRGAGALLMAPERVDLTCAERERF